MQIDMHYYATYAIARLGGFETTAAHVIATSSQFVNEASHSNSQKNSNLEMLFAICTTHSYEKSWTNPEIHRLVWVPFHFYPGGKGETLEEKLLCRKDSKIANEMFDNHIALSKKDFYLHLLGVASHVYLDTFAHYGFSGICSELNLVENGFAESASNGLGHGVVATYCDCPYLSWEFKYQKPRYKNGVESPRDNKVTYFDGLKKLHEKLIIASKRKYCDPDIKDLPTEQIREIINLKGTKEERINRWLIFIKEHLKDTDVYYKGKKWNEEKDNFDKFKPPHHIGDCYKFHQAAVYHRWYTLKDLLPKHGIYVC